MHGIAQEHALTRDKAARLYRKGAGQESRLAYLGHALMENRNGLVAAALFSERRLKGATLGADKGYDADHLCEKIAETGAQPAIPPKRNRPFKRAYDLELYKERNIIERLFNKRLEPFRIEHDQIVLPEPPEELARLLIADDVARAVRDLGD